MCVCVYLYLEETCSSHDEAFRRSGKMKGTALSVDELQDQLWQFAKKNEEVFNIPLVSLWCLSLGQFFCLERVLPPLSALSVVFFCMRGWRLTSFLPCGGYAAEAGLPNFGSCWQRLKQRAICGGGLGPQNLATRFVEKWHPRFLLIFFQMAWNHHTVVKLDG